MPPIWHWTQEDYALIKELYPSATKEEILSKIKHHSWAAIQRKASKLKIRRNVNIDCQQNIITVTKNNKSNLGTLNKMKAASNSKPWTDEEHEILEIFYPRSSKTVILDTLRKRSWLEITIEAELLGIKRHIKDDEGKKKENRLYIK